MAEGWGMPVPVPTVPTVPRIPVPVLRPVPTVGRVVVVVSSSSTVTVRVIHELWAVT